MSGADFFWLLLILYSLWPVYRQQRIHALRQRLLARLERRRGTRAIAMIHRQESLGLFGFPIARFIDIEDSERVLRAIRQTPPDRPIDLILHTPGGLVLAAEQIAQAIARHPARVTVFVPHYAMSGGTLIALAADEVVMDENAVLGPVDPQIGSWPASSILAAVADKHGQVDDETLILADIARKAIRQVQERVYRILREKMDEGRARDLARLLTEGRWTHDFPLMAEDLRSLGVPVRVGLPDEIYQLMELYPQAPGRRPSVQYVPGPAPARGWDRP